MVCEDCEEVFCSYDLKEADNGLFLCEECRNQLEEEYPVITFENGDEQYKGTE
jgi:hypothetical protein